MFALRIIEETRENENEPFEQVIENFEVGKSYSVIKKGITKEFDRIMDEQFPEIDKADISALLCIEKGDEKLGNVFFIWPKTSLRVYSYFIMTESGKTFEKL